MFRKSYVVMVLACGLMAFSDTLAQQVPAPLKTAAERDLGVFVVDSKGMTLYIFGNDKEPGKSTRYGGCAETWPPFSPRPGDPAPVKPLNIITRKDGSKQYAYKGKPLYYYAFDSKPGDIEGQGLGNRWWVVSP